MSMVTKEWVPAVTHNINRHLLAEYRPFKITDITLEGKDDENKITLEIQKGQKVKRLQFNTNLKTLTNSRKVRTQRGPWPQR